jgi:hypothetical protein
MNALANSGSDPARRGHTRCACWAKTLPPAIATAKEGVPDHKQGRKGQKIAAMWSTDSGETWSNPVAYVVWQNSGPNGKVQIRLAKSTDHGQTWTQLGVVNGDPSTDAHTPSVAVDEFGTVAVSYYDYRFNDVDSDDGLETTHWIRRSSDGGASFRPDEMLGTTFDTRKAPYSSGYFLGDYDGLASIGASFEPFWVSNEGSTAGKPVLNGGVDFADRTNVFCAFVP